MTGSDPPSRVASENLNFESGDFARWRTLAFGSRAWHVYEDGTTPPDPADSDPRIVFKVPTPPEGNAAAVTDMHDGTRILHRMLKLDGRFKLRLTVFYEGSAKFFSPPSLDFSLAEPNQQFRIAHRSHRARHLDGAQAHLGHDLPDVAGRPANAPTA